MTSSQTSCACASCHANTCACRSTSNAPVTDAARCCCGSACGC